MVRTQHDQAGSQPDLLSVGTQPELKHAWPQRLREFMDVSAAALRDAGLEPERAEALAAASTLAVAHYMGGRPLYLPTGKSLRDALRRRRIYQAWRGSNLHGGALIEMLCRSFSVSHETVYRAIEEGRAIEQARIQPGLF